MDLKQVRAFVAVLDEGGFAAASRRLSLGRATVSERVSHLEQEVGALLLVRAPLTTTAAGATFEPYARRMIANADAAVSAVANGSTSISRALPDTLRIGQLLSGAAELTEPIYRALRLAMPSVRVRVTELSLAETDSALLNGRVDVAFLRSPVEDFRFETVQLYLTPRVVAIARAHRLAERPSLTIDDLDGIPLTAVNHLQGAATQRFYGLIDERNGEAARLMESLTFAEALHNVLVYGAAATPCAGSARSLSAAGVRFLPLVDGRPSGPVAACRRADRRPVVRTFMELTAQIAAGCQGLVRDALPLPGT
jgi:DNA-binding transcriptional LysR family regulator